MSAQKLFSEFILFIHIFFKTLVLDKDWIEIFLSNPCDVVFTFRHIVM